MGKVCDKLPEASLLETCSDMTWLLASRESICYCYIYIHIVTGWAELTRKLLRLKLKVLLCVSHLSSRGSYFCSPIYIPCILRANRI